MTDCSCSRTTPEPTPFNVGVGHDLDPGTREMFADIVSWARWTAAFPGLTCARPNLLGTKVSRLVVAEFTDPARIAGRKGSSASGRLDLEIRRTAADEPVAAAGDALPLPDTAVAPPVLATGLVLGPTSTNRSTRPPPTSPGRCH